MQAASVSSLSPASASASASTSAFISALDNMYKNKLPYDSGSGLSSTAAAHPGHQYGENNHVEYKAVDVFSTNTSLSAVSALQEKIMQFYFQLIRTSDAHMIQNVAQDTRDILSAVMSGISKNSYNNHGNNIDENDGCNEYKAYMDMGVMMFKILAHTRDIVSGKGEYMLFYVMLVEWAKVDFQFFDFMIRSLVYDIVDVDATNTDACVQPRHPLGSWKDMKYFLTYLKSVLIDSTGANTRVFQDYKDIQQQRDLYSKCVNTIVILVNQQLRIDYEAYYMPYPASISLVAKWIPREKSKKFGWLYYYLTMNYFQHEIPSDQTHPSYERAVNRAFMNYRKMISALNKKLDTTQVKMCDKNWSDIDFSHVTSITTHKQTKSFLNMTHNGKTTRYPHDADREGCRYNYEEYLRDVKEGKRKLNGARVSVVDFVKSALANKHLLVSASDKESSSSPSPSSSSSSVIDAIDAQWKDSFGVSSSGLGLGNMIAMCDVSGSMESENSNPLCAAIGLSIRVAERSALGPRIMTFSERPQWIQLGIPGESDTFVKQVVKVRGSNWGMTTNFYYALDLIRQIIEDTKMPRDVVENLTLVVFSDMQMCDASPELKSIEKKNTLFENIRQMFAKMGERMYSNTSSGSMPQAPLKPPHIVFWNLRKTTGFPCLSTDENVSMMSGFSPALLNVFCQKGIDGLKNYTPWNTLNETLKNTRYSIFENAFKTIVRK
jgi:hypothetical protein